LAEAGITPANPTYSENVVRTNVMDSYNAGTVREMMDPDVAPEFPVWKMSNPNDGRTGEDHAPWVGKYFPNYVSFFEVRNWFIVHDGEVIHDTTGKGR